ncbi:MAG: hypothetical protein EXR72_07715 [Myxococcales bacterium]|nr:hypothetical protein [Myxococcales bacterium]
MKTLTYAAQNSSPDRTGALASPLPNQSLIARALAAWDAWAAETFASEVGARIARGWFVRVAGFHHLLEAMRQGSASPFSLWTLLVARTAPRELGRSPASRLLRLGALAGLPAPRTADDPNDASDPSDDSDDDCRPESTRRGRRPSSTPLRGQGGIAARVQGQIRAVVQRLAAGDERTAERFRDELVAFQRRHSTPEHIARSLRIIAGRARRLGACSFAERALDQALAIAPEDGSAAAQLSILLRSQGRYREAHTAARRGAALDTSHRALGMLAEALRAQGGRRG